MYFDSFADFLAMGEHARYVWSAYGLGLLTVLVNLAIPLLGRRAYLREQARRLRRETPQ